MEVHVSGGACEWRCMCVEVHVSGGACEWRCM